MNIAQSLFESEHICLGPINFEKDPEIEARWSEDADYLRMVSLEPARPSSPAQIKKMYEDIEKGQEENKNLFYFTIRMRADDRLIGFARLDWIDWSNGCGYVALGIGDPNDRNQGYGTETLRLLLRFAFDELNLYRLAAIIPEYNAAALRLFEKAGFVEEVRRRQAVNRFGRRWDLLHLGVLRNEWETHRSPDEPAIGLQYERPAGF
jgi:RimJ/RimL family protein N-acetyltransferase